MTVHAAVAPARSRAETIQRIVTPGGIEAWLVESYAVPLVALEFAMRGGAAQDPTGKAGLSTLLAGLLDEGAGPYDARGFHRAIDDLRHPTRLRLRPRHHLRPFADARRATSTPAFELLRLALCEARLERRGDRPRARRRSSPG